MLRRLDIVCVMFLLLALVTGFTAVYGEETDEVHLEKVHTIYWKAVLKKDLKRGKTTAVKAGSVVTVINRKKRGKSTILYGAGKKADVPNSWLSFRSDLASVGKEGDYNTATKEAFINKRTGVKGKEEYLLWVSLDKQRVNVFRASEGRWKLYRVFKCSTGSVRTPTSVGWHKVDYKRPWVKGLKWYTEVVGGGIHKWPGRFNKSLYGKHVASGGCIRMTEKDAHQIYKMIPVKTRVLVY